MCKSLYLFLLKKSPA